MVVVFFLNWGLTSLKKVIDSAGDSNGDVVVVIILAILSFIMSLGVISINVGLSKVVRMLTEKEVHDSLTNFNLSISFKLVAALFVNTGFIPLFVNLGKNNWFTEAGLIVDILYNTISVSFVGPLFYLVNFGYIWKKIKQKRELKKGEKSKLT